MKERGFALIAVIIAFVLISLMAVFFTNIVSFESNVSVDKYLSIRAYYAAQAGIENAVKALSQVNSWYTLKEGVLEVRNDNLDGAMFETNLKLPATALRRNLNKNSTTIYVFDTQRFPTTNILLLIESELIFCTGKTANSFTNCQRGYNGSARERHLAGEAVHSVAQINSVNTSLRSITVNNNDKFLTAGRLEILFSNLSSVSDVNYTDKGNNTFYGCDDLSWYTPGTYYVINSGTDITEQIEINTKGFFNGVERKIVNVISH